MKKYNHSEIEKKWQRIWQQKKVFRAKDFSKKEKKYVLVEFPYPSGEGLHMGHLRPYTAGDVYSRFLRLKGYEVMYPIGWDAFGLPAENYAIKKGVHPSITTKKNIANAKRQMQSWGLSFDWSREINTTDPGYYQWTQWLFLQFYKAGLAYEATGLINWCPKDKTGLANEEVIDGRCERCGTVVEKKELRQWYLKITEYAEKLLEGLKDLPNWPDAVKLQQENWIGKSIGAEIDFLLDFKKNPEDNERCGPNGERAKIKVFTTRPDTIFGATYLVLAPEHLWVTLATDENHDVLENKKEVKKYIESVKNRSDIERSAEGKEKTGVELKGVKAVNPATGEEIPVWVADYVLGHYGTGAIMAVPAHDQRDFEFANKFGLPVVPVVSPCMGSKETAVVSPCMGSKEIVDKSVPGSDPGSANYKPNTDYGILINSGEFTGQKSDDAIPKMAEKFGTVTVRYKLRDWVFSRQRYWGEPIPIIHCEQCAVKEYKAKLEINFYNHATWNALLSGRKTVETRALNPEEASRYFGNVSAGDKIKFVNKKTGQARVFEVLQAERFASIEELYSRKDLLPGINGSDTVPTLQQLTAAYQSYSPDYVERIKKNGLVIWKVKIATTAVPVPEKDLPVQLPSVKEYEPTGTGESPLAAIKKWVNVKCPKCKGSAKRETNTMPQWAGSSWYYLRYVDPNNKKQFADKKKQKYWTPVDAYFGGMEHTTLHLLYSRFWNLFLYDQKLVTSKEPYEMRKPHGIILASDGEKMSKSRGNVVNPDVIVEKFGADTLRMYELFLGPHEMTVSWNDQGILGVRRFLDRMWNWVNEIAKAPHQRLENHMARKSEVKDTEKVERALNRLIKKVTEDLENFRFNTSVSSFMEFHNEIKNEFITLESVKKFLVLLYPFAPHIAEELHQLMKGKSSLQREAWPKYDASKIADTTVEIVIQINGKVKGKISMAAGAAEETVKAEAMKLETVAKTLAADSLKRVIFVPNKLMNLVV